MNEWHWRDTALRPRILFFDALTAAPLLALVLHWDMRLVYATVFLMVSSTILDMLGLSIPVLWSLFKRTVVGRYRPPLSMRRYSRYVPVTLPIREYK
ncbi:IcmT/TraK family protein [Thiolapillus sp.]|uniref:IcmT/TraK family protein n=1 Tax=Thiolapillus sp. TaxID=2017437 RepID=UPI0025F9B8AE|nr:IcmT/TraK family protein [Thiolapillus sp.]